jgi:hypothetical protein
LYICVCLFTKQRAIATCKEDASSSGPLSKTAPNTAPTPQWCETWAHYLSTRFAGAAAASIVAVSADGKSYTVNTRAAEAFVREVLHTNVALTLSLVYHTKTVCV